MHSFTDNKKNQWTIDLTVGSIRRIHSMTGINLLNITENSGENQIDRLLNEPDTLTDVVFAACKEEADRRQITNEMFGFLFGGEHMERMQTALFEEILDFFPEAKRITAKAVIQARIRFAKKITESLGNALIEELNQWSASLSSLPDV